LYSFIIENDLKENLNHYNEVPMDTSECIVKSVAEDEPMDVTKCKEEFGQPTKDRTFDQIIRKPIKTSLHNRRSNCKMWKTGRTGRVDHHPSGLNVLEGSTTTQAEKGRRQQESKLYWRPGEIRKH
jgi:hypothetical protein